MVRNDGIDRRRVEGATAAALGECARAGGCAVCFDWWRGRAVAHGGATQHARYRCRSAPLRDDVPREALLAAGFEYTGRHAHSDNWRAPGDGPLATRVAVQFSAEDVGIAEAVARAKSMVFADGFLLRVATAEDLITLKLADAGEPQRRASKREHDLADVLTLLEEHPQLRTPQLAARVREIRNRILDAGFDG